MLSRVIGKFAISPNIIVFESVVPNLSNQAHRKLILHKVVEEFNEDGAVETKFSRCAKEVTETFQSLVHFADVRIPRRKV